MEENKLKLILQEILNFAGTDGENLKNGICREIFTHTSSFLLQNKLEKPENYTLISRVEAREVKLFLFKKFTEYQTKQDISSINGFWFKTNKERVIFLNQVLKQ